MNQALFFIQLLLSIQHAIPPAPRMATATGTANLLISSCDAGETVVIRPGDQVVTADQDGFVMAKVPAQNKDDDPYSIITAKGHETAIGTVKEGNGITVSCPQ